MNTLSRSLSLATVILAIAATGAMAQNNNPNQSGGSRGSKVAMPEYPAGYTNPALSPGRILPGTSAAGLPAVENPEVPGATGATVVRGDHSTIEGDRQGTIEQKTGADTASDAPG
jgi:hypothetical protein